MSLPERVERAECDMKKWPGHLLLINSLSQQSNDYIIVIGFAQKMIEFVGEVLNNIGSG